MDIVATGAAYVSLGVRRTIEVGMRCRMASQALGIYFFGRGLGGIEDLGDIPAALDVGSARTMATLAVHAGRAMLRRELGMRVAGEFLGHLFVAGGADLSTHIRVRSRILGLRRGRLCSWVGLGRGSSQSSGAQDARAKHHNQTSSQSRQLPRSRTK